MTFPIQSSAVYLITRGKVTDLNFEQEKLQVLDIVRTAVEEKVALVQIREKQLSGRKLFELATGVTELTHGTSTRVLVNDRADIALAAKADGVHLATNSLPCAVIRVHFPKGFIIGVSTHTFDETVQASKTGADFAVLAPVFDTLGKGEPTGLTLLTEVCEEVRPFPVMALGGVDETNCDSIFAAGASGIAAIRSLNDPVSLRSIVAKLRK
ncbi:MAG: thiamine phosphate synthase [Acidobacteriota bacterium]